LVQAARCISTTWRSSWRCTSARASRRSHTTDSRTSVSTAPAHMAVTGSVSRWGVCFTLQLTLTYVPQRFLAWLAYQHTVREPSLYPRSTFVPYHRRRLLILCLCLNGPDGRHREACGVLRQGRSECCFEDNRFPHTSRVFVSIRLSAMSVYSAIYLCSSAEVRMRRSRIA
jgi:hypothetical protein